MRHVKLGPILAAAALLVSPTVAVAQGWRWFDKLSGPGPFHGYETETRLVCFRERDAGSENQSPPTVDPRLRALSVVGGLLGPCVFDVGDATSAIQTSLDVSFGFLTALDNDLDYSSTPSADRDVTLTTVEPSLSWTIADYLDVGFGVGVFWFSGPAFQTFTRVAIQPVRITVKPFGSKKPRHDFPRPVIQWNLTVLPQGFRAADFGAGGSFQVTRDVVWKKNFAVLFDLEPVYRRLARRR